MRLPAICLLAVAAPVFAAPPGKPLTYDDDVLPVLRATCLNCHNAEKARGGLNLATYGKLMEGGSSGVVVKAGDPDGSRLYTLAAHKEQPVMPPSGGKMPDEGLNKIKLWIEQGVRENAGSKAAVAAKPKTEIGLKSIVKGRPPGPPPMPAAKLRQDPLVKSRRPGAITALAASPWAPLVAVGGPKQVFLYHTDTLDLLGVLPFDHGQPNVIHFSRNGELLLVGGGRAGASGKVVLFNVKTGQKVTEVGNEPDAVLAADLSADQTQIALGGPNKLIRIYATADGALLREIKKHTDWVQAVEFSPDGVLLATGDRSGGLHVWEANTGRPYFELRGHTGAIMDVSWRYDSNVLSSCSEDTTVRLWEMENGGQIKSWGAHGGGAQSVKYHHDGRIVSTGRDRVVKAWDGNGTALRNFEAMPDVSLRAMFAHDGARVVGGDWSGKVHVWQSADGKFVGVLDANPPTVAERLAAAEKETAAAQAAATQTVAAYTAAKAAADKAAAEFAAAQKAVTDKAAALQTANAAVPPAKTALDQANATLATAQNVVAARDVAARAYAEAAAKIKAAADASQQNPELQQATKKSFELSGQAAAEFAAAQKSFGEVTAAQKAAADKFAAAQKVAADAAVQAAEAPKVVTAKQPAVKATADAVVVAKAQADAAAAALTAAKAKLERLKAATAAK